MKILKTRTFWTIYIICASLLFFYILFPSDAIEAYLADRIRRAHPGLAVKIGRLRPALPPGLKLYQVRIDHLGRRIAEIEDLKITPDILSLLSATTHLNFRGAGYGGNIEGGIDITGTASQTDVVALGADLAGVQVSRIEALRSFTTHKISGNLDAKLNFNSAIPGEALSGNLTLTEGRIEFSAPIMKQNVISFDTIEAEVIFDGKSVRIKNCRLDANLLDADVSGTIKFTGLAARKILDLSGTVRPHEELLAALGQSVSELIAGRNLQKRGIAFKISGPLDSPYYSFY